MTSSSTQSSDFVTASAPQVFFDPGYDAIDGNFITAGGVNYMYYKNNTNSTLLVSAVNAARPARAAWVSVPASPATSVSRKMADTTTAVRCRLMNLPVRYRHESGRAATG